jgi:hypothetical protein
MPSHPRNRPEQEHSIKARAHELFVETTKAEADSRPTKPFPVYLRETPAQPLSPGTKTVLWLLGIVVALLFLIALWRVTQRRAPAHRPEPNPPAAEAQAVLLGRRVASARLPA